MAFVLHTLGDSVLDCAKYTGGVAPGNLLVRNDDRLYPEFRGRDLRSRSGFWVALDHQARDGATIESLFAQRRRMRLSGEGATIVSIGGNDLLTGLLFDPDMVGIDVWAETLDRFLAGMPEAGPIVLATVYDPTFDGKLWLPKGVEEEDARAKLARLNSHLREIGERHGAVADLYSHFMSKGTPAWFVHTIEPSILGASEVRRVFLQALERLGVVQRVQAVPARV